MISSGLCVTALRDFLQGNVHCPDDVYKLALYTRLAIISPMTEVYTPHGEVVGQGYEKGGQKLEGRVCGAYGNWACQTFGGPCIWKNSFITACGAMVYNTKNMRSLVVVSFNEDIVSTNGNFIVPMPPLTADEALIRICLAPPKGGSYAQ